MRQIHYTWFAILTFLVALGSALLMPALWGWDVAVSLNQPDILIYLLLGAGGIVLLADLLMAWQAFMHQRKQGYSSLWVPILGQTSLYLLTIWVYFVPIHANALRTLTLPITMLGIGLLFLTLNWSQKAERQAPASPAMYKSARRLSWLSVILAVYGLLFFGITWDWQIGLVVATASLLVIDPRWPLIVAAQRRFEAIDRLKESDIKIHHPEVLDHVKEIKQALMEKTGVLTSPQLTVYNVYSINDEYSDQDVLAIMAGLEQEIGGPYAQAMLTYSQSQGVYPTQANDASYIPLVGVKGSVQGADYELASATYATRNQYEFKRQWLNEIVELGNSVSLLIQGKRAIGVVAFGAPLIRSLTDTDKFFVGEKISTKIASSDTKGSLIRIQEMMQSLEESKGSLAVNEKVRWQKQWALEAPAVLVTNQPVPAEVKPELVVSFLDQPAEVDITITNLSEIKDIWKTAKKLNQIDHGSLVLWQTVLIILIVLAAGLEIFINMTNSMILFVPIFTIFVRSLITTVLKYWLK